MESAPSTIRGFDKYVDSMMTHRMQSSQRARAERARSFLRMFRQQVIEERARQRERVQRDPAYQEILRDPEFQRLDAALTFVRRWKFRKTKHWADKLCDELTPRQKQKRCEIGERAARLESDIVWSLANLMRQYGLPPQSPPTPRPMDSVQVVEASKAIAPEIAVQTARKRREVVPKRIPETLTRAVSLRAAARWFHVDYRVLVNWINDGSIAAKWMGGHRWCFDLAEVIYHNPSARTAADPAADKQFCRAS